MWDGPGRGTEPHLDIPRAMALPDAPGGGPGRARGLPDLRDGPAAPQTQPFGGGGELQAAFQKILDRPRLYPPDLFDRHERDGAQQSVVCPDGPKVLELGA